MDDNQWGFKNKTKWILYEKAPYTASGLNEIVAAAETRKQLAEISRLLRLRKGGYAVTRLESLKERKVINMDDEMLAVSIQQVKDQINQAEEELLYDE